MRLTNLVTTDAVADVLPQADGTARAVAELAPKPVQDRFVEQRQETPEQAASRKVDQDGRSAWFRPAASGVAGERRDAK